jgi:hypothetical protein
MTNTDRAWLFSIGALLATAVLLALWTLHESARPQVLISPVTAPGSRGQNVRGTGLTLGLVLGASAFSGQTVTVLGPIGHMY